MNIKEVLNDLLLYHSDAPLLFNSPEFFFMAIVVMSVYAAIYRHKLSRTGFLLAFSLFFYYKTSGIFVLLLATTLTAVWLMVRRMNRCGGSGRKWWLGCTVALVVGILGYFKYANFMGENIALLMRLDFHHLDIFLPVGISFYSFQLLSYAIDVYRCEIDDERDFLDYAFYISFFPQLVAGPIVRAKDFLPQLKKPVVVKRAEVDKGALLIMTGLLKKSILADYLAQYNDLVFGNPMAYSGAETMVAIYGYAIQIYCDFSGYTDMAIGMGKIMGFDLGVNFNKPYQSASLSEFWHRWHISLSRWLRDYLYIPLGGNRKGHFRTYLNLMITMLIGGLWHGAHWKFIFWGGMHGLGLVVDKLWRELTRGRFEGNRVFRVIGWLVTLHFVVALWVFFRAESFATAWLMLQRVFTDFNWAVIPTLYQTRRLLVWLIVVAVAIHAVPASRFPKIERAWSQTPFVFKAVTFVILVQCILQIKSDDIQPFIYFQF